MNKLNPDKIQYFIDLISPQVNNLEKKNKGTYEFRHILKGFRYHNMEKISVYNNLTYGSGRRKKR